jgi:hypothetical protein
MEKLMIRYAASQTLLPQVRTVARSLYSVRYKDGDRLIRIMPALSPTRLCVRCAVGGRAGLIGLGGGELRLPVLVRVISFPARAAVPLMW